MPENDITAMNDSIYIMPLKTEHINEVCAIEKECFTDPWTRNIFLELLDYPVAVNLVAAEVNNNNNVNNIEEIVGYCVFYHVLDECQIMNIAVKESKRNRKIATKLLLAVFAYAKAENITAFTLEVRQSNDKAIALYKKFGFKNDGVRKNYYKHPKEDAFLMSLRGDSV